jgi:hypothetical protein
VAVVVVVVLAETLAEPVEHALVLGQPELVLMVLADFVEYALLILQPD